MNLIVYSTGCPRCKILAMTMDKKGVPYEVNNDIATMEQLGIMSVPVLSVDGKLLPYDEAIKWVNSYQEEQREKQ